MVPFWYYIDQNTIKMKTIKYFVIIISSMALLATSLTANTRNGDKNPKQGDHVAYPINGYSTFAVGVRAMGTTGITFKQFNRGGKAFEAILGLGHNSFSITALSERYSSDMEVDHLGFYYGMGGHLAFRSDTRFGVERNRFSDEDDSFGAGIDFILGLEFNIPKTPLAVSFDMKPFVEITSSGNAYAGLDPGLGIKLFF